MFPENASIELNRDADNPAVSDPLQIMGFGLTDEEGFGLEEDLMEVEVFAVDDDRVSIIMYSIWMCTNE